MHVFSRNCELQYNRNLHFSTKDNLSEMENLEKKNEKENNSIWAMKIMVDPLRCCTENNNNNTQFFFADQTRFLELKN